MGFLEEWYSNGYYPSEQVQVHSEEYSQALIEQQKHISQIIKSLGEDGERIFDEYLSVKAQVDEMEMASAFAEGFRLALRIVHQGK